MHIHQLLDHGPIGTCLCRRCDDGWNVEELANGGVCDDILPEDGGVPVTGELEETDLVVDDEEDLLYC